ncbi:MAG: lactate racemase domain-containing protein [Clostridiaceae bacterium]
MQTFLIPWGQWYAQTTKELTFPEDWDVRFCGMPHAEALTKEQVTAQIDNPIGSERLEALASGKHSACIVIDDISRPTPGAFLLPIVIEKLVSAGIGYERIKVLVALGGHRPMTRQEMALKVGSWTLEHVQVLNHSPFAADLVTIPDEKQTIKINRNFIEAELRIALGCIVPHTLAGFSGGAKAVIPGIGGIETLHSNHTLVFADQSESMSFKTSTCDPDNAMRKNMEEIVGKVGLDFIINVVLNDQMKVADAFAGHFVQAHRAACARAMESLKTSLVENADILVLSAYPKDTEYSQIGTCFAVLGHHKQHCIKQGGTIVAMTAASEGAGFHSLFGPGMRLFSPHDDNMPPMELRGTETLVFSDGVQKIDIRQFYRADPPDICGAWSEVLSRLTVKYRAKAPLVAIYPMGAIQIGEMEEHKESKENRCEREQRKEL